MSKREAEKQLTKNETVFLENSDQDVIDLAKQAPKEVLLQRKIAVPQSRKKRYTELSSTYSNPFANLSGSNGTQSFTWPTQPPTSTFSFVTPLKQDVKKNISFESSNSIHLNSSLLSSGNIKNEYDLFLHQRAVNHFFQKAINASLNEDPFGDLTKICHEYLDYRKEIDKSSYLNNSTELGNEQNIPVQESSLKDSSLQQPFKFTSQTSNSNMLSTSVPPKSTFDYKNESNKNEVSSPLKKSMRRNEENKEEVTTNSTSNEPLLSAFITSTKKNEENVQKIFESKEVKNECKTVFTSENTNNFPKISEKKLENQSNPEYYSNLETKSISIPPITSASNLSSFTFPIASEAGNSETNKNSTSNSPIFSFVLDATKTEKKPFSFETKKQDIEINNKSSNEIEINNNKNLFSFTSIPKTQENTLDSTNSMPTFNFGLPVPSKDANSSDFSWTPDKGIKFSTFPSKNVNDTMDKPPTFQFVNPLSTGSFKNEDISQYKLSESVGFEFGNKTNTGFSFGQSSAFSSALVNFQQKNVPGSEITEDVTFPEEPRTNDHLIAAKGEGEENEDSIFTTKAKIYKYSTKENKFLDLGIGILKLNVDKDTLKARVLARLQGSGKVIINIGLRKDFQYLITGKKSVKIPAIPSEGTGIDTYLVRVRDEETSKKLADLLESKKLGKQ
ncbi:hypothetical protein PCK1_000443 [Pneumocystis canis]|nr:hypothetical protein PCK1_000443 [Pneumocystis canis]